MNRTIHLCTLFDSNYLDKGLTLYCSLCDVCSNFILYIFAFDDISFRILKDMHLNNMEIIGLEKFETKELLEVKEKRTRGEYCWTCTPIIIEYVLDNYNVENCTYIDADMFFYQSPQTLLEEFYNSGKSVGLMEHRFPNTFYGRNRVERSGKYCVEFNTFANNEEGRSLLEMWKVQCLEKCDIENCGDQYYLTDWGDKYEQVYEYQHLGGGVAPWNLMRYRIKETTDGLQIIHKGKRYKVIFYHFQNIQYLGDGRVKINVVSAIDGGFISRKTIRKIYYPYLYRIEMMRDKLEEKYHLEMYKDGCNRKINLVKFNFKKFLKSILRRLRKESLWSAIDLIARVFRKKDDIIDLNEVRVRKGM